MKNKMTYFFIVLLTFLFTYIFNVKEIYTFFYMLIILPLVDYIFFKYISNKVDINVNIYRNAVDKNKNILCNIILKNKGILPIPYIFLELSVSKLLIGENLSLITSLSHKENIVKQIEVIPKHIGIGKINIDSIEIKSLFGLFVKNYSTELDDNKIMILPEIMELEGVDRLLEDEIRDSCGEDDDYSYIKGDVGYEYREYYPGDPLNRVNWKISSKKNSLIIRKDTMLSKFIKVIILDSYLAESENYFNISDLLIEGAISLVNTIYLENYEVIIIYKFKGKWMVNSLNKNIDLEDLQRKLTIYEFSNEENRFVDFKCCFEEHVDFILVTSNKDSDLEEFIKDLECCSNSVCIVSNNRNRIYEREFYLREDYRVERI